MPDPGLQALILCGPGSSFTTFMAKPEENPKALLPIANRPMVWYPIDFCHRMGITGKTLTWLSKVCEANEPRYNTCLPGVISKGHLIGPQHQPAFNSPGNTEAGFVGPRLAR